MRGGAGERREVREGLAKQKQEEERGGGAGKTRVDRGEGNERGRRAKRGERVRGAREGGDFEQGETRERCENRASGRQGNRSEARQAKTQERAREEFAKETLLEESSVHAGHEGRRA